VEIGRLTKKQAIKTKDRAMQKRWEIAGKNLGQTELQKVEIGVDEKHETY